MTLEEGRFLLQLLKQDTLEPRQRELCEAAEKIYGRKYKSLIAKAQDGDPHIVHCNDNTGERLLKEKSIAHFTKQMEHYHYAVSQLVHNIGG